MYLFHLFCIALLFSVACVHSWLHFTIQQYHTHITQILQYHREDQLSDEDIDREFYGEEGDNSNTFEYSEIDNDEKIKKREKGKLISHTL